METVDFRTDKERAERSGTVVNRDRKLFIFNTFLPHWQEVTERMRADDQPLKHLPAKVL